MSPKAALLGSHFFKAACDPLSCCTAHGGLNLQCENTGYMAQTATPTLQGCTQMRGALSPASEAVPLHGLPSSPRGIFQEQPTVVKTANAIQVPLVCYKC